MNIQIVTDNYGTEHVIIDRGNDEFTSMTKSVYEEQYGPIEEVAE